MITNRGFVLVGIEPTVSALRWIASCDVIDPHFVLLRLVQDVGSFSSIEKIWPASILRFFTTQIRPLTSANFAS